MQVGLEPAAHCAAGKGLPEALQREPIEADRLASDLAADPCVRAALRTLGPAASPAAAHVTCRISMRVAAGTRKPCIKCHTASGMRQFCCHLSAAGLLPHP